MTPRIVLRASGLMMDGMAVYRYVADPGRPGCEERVKGSVWSMLNVRCPIKQLGVQVSRENSGESES